jgi:hypothetical protein
MDDRPSWAQRITTEREARRWNKPQFIEAMRAHSDKELARRSGHERGG